MERQKKTVFLLGSKGIPARYGGFETFIEKLTLNQIDKSIQYYVSCQSSPKEFKKGIHEYNGAKCFYIRVPNIGSARAVYYDLKSLEWALKYIKKNRIQKATILICACRIGPIIAAFFNRIHKLDARLIVNPDGHEWMRAKWNTVIKAYWRFSERLCVKNADFLVCDSKNIEEYIKKKYAQYSPKTTFIAYGSDTSLSFLADYDKKIISWYEKWGVKPGHYYLNIARFVPENNYETILREFMASNSEKPLVIVSSIKGNKFYKKIEKKLDIKKDERIKFVGEIYDQELLKKIRENAYGYIHGHSVGGTNPSLLEALGTVDLNLIYECVFNSEVAIDGGLYWNKKEGNLKEIIDRGDKMRIEEIKDLGDKAHKRISEYYTWSTVCKKYESVFINLD